MTRSRMWPAGGMGHHSDVLPNLTGGLHPSLVPQPGHKHWAWHKTLNHWTICGNHIGRDQCSCTSEHCAILVHQVQQPSILVKRCHNYVPVSLCWSILLCLKNVFPKRVKRQAKSRGYNGLQSSVMVFWKRALHKYVHICAVIHIWKGLFQMIIIKIGTEIVSPFLEWRLTRFGKELFIS